MPTKGGREEKEQATAIATTTIATPTTSLAIIEPNDEDLVTTSENLWKEDTLTNEAESSPSQLTTIRNTSDARGIFSNMVKTLNKCKSSFWSHSFQFCGHQKEVSVELLLTIQRERNENHWWQPHLD